MATQRIFCCADLIAAPAVAIDEDDTITTHSEWERHFTAFVSFAHKRDEASSAGQEDTDKWKNVKASYVIHLTPQAVIDMKGGWEEATRYFLAYPSGSSDANLDPFVERNKEDAEVVRFTRSVASKAYQCDVHAKRYNFKLWKAD